MTSGPSQIELVTLAVYALGGEQRPVDTEDVAVKAYGLAPTRFAWRKYPAQINLELVRVYLSAAKNLRKCGFLEGSGKSGWSLTPIGLEWVRTTGKHLLGGKLDRRREETAGGPLGEQKWRRERERVMSTRAWELWAAGVSDVPRRDAESVFRIDSYAVGRLRTQKLARLLSLFEGDDQLRPFLDRMAAIIEGGGEG